MWIKSNQRKMFAILIIVMLFFATTLSEVLAQKAGKGANKQASETELNEGLTEIKTSISELMKKVYSASLFSPRDNNKLIDLRIKLYDLWSKNPTNRELAKPFYDTAIIFNAREMYPDAKEFLRIVIENFPPAEEVEEGTVSIDYSAKAQVLLKRILKDHPDSD